MNKQNSFFILKTVIIQVHFMELNEGKYKGRQIESYNLSQKLYTSIHTKKT